MTSIKIKCPHCNRKYRVTEKALGRNVKCASEMCGETFLVAEQQPDEPASTSPKASVQPSSALKPATIFVDEETPLFQDLASAGVFFKPKYRILIWALTLATSVLLIIGLEWRHWNQGSRPSTLRTIEGNSESEVAARDGGIRLQPPTDPERIFPVRRLLDDVDAAGFVVPAAYARNAVPIETRIERFVRFGTARNAYEFEHGDQQNKAIIDHSIAKHRTTLRATRFRIIDLNFNAPNFPNWKEIASTGLILEVRLPLRVHFDVSKTAASPMFAGKLAMMHRCDVNLNSWWFLTKDHALKNCSVDAANRVMTAGGVVYHPESRQTILSLVVTDTVDKLKNIAGNPSDHLIEIEIEDLEYSRPDTWGFFRRDKLAQPSGACECIRGSGETGGLLDDPNQPRYWLAKRHSSAEHPEQNPPECVQAKLVSLVIFGSDGAEVGAYSSNGFPAASVKKRLAFDAAAIGRPAEANAVRTIKMFGGSVTFDEKQSDHPAIGVELGNASLMVLKELKSLKSLAFGGAKFRSKDELKVLKELTSLESLTIRAVSDHTACLAGVRELKNLKLLRIRFDVFTTVDADKLRKDLPNCKILRE